MAFMRLWIAAVGRVKAGPARDLYDDYAGRLNWPVTVREVEARKQLPVAERRRQEAELLKAAVPASATLVVLDERGANLTSTAFAGQIGAWRDSGVADLAFFIGGADGIDQTVRSMANLLLCMGTMTWPHQLVRGMLAEQLYRAQQILAGHPYHRN